jgi:protein-S-isoprenylcysteine O-methyltransferase Ste14
MSPAERWRPSRTQVILAAACLLSSAVGYPVALLAHQSLGWVLVMLGGLFLFALAAVTVLEVHRHGDR